MEKVYSRELFERNRVHAVVLCGGSGTRLWPLSRNDKPKQFLALGGTSRTLLQTSLDRLNGMVPSNRRWLVLSPHHHAVAAEQTRGLCEHILVEPEARNTAPAVAFAAWRLLQSDPESTMVILSSDHVIGKLEGFEESIARAVVLAEQGRFVTIGIRPTYPATGFGYIETAETLDPGGFHVASFREKPAREVAEEFLLSGRYLWNAGIFVWKTKVFWEAFKALAPEVALPISQARDADFAEIYSKLPKIPIDIAFMEKASRVACVPSLFSWDDVGSWAAVKECFPSDGMGNSLAGDVLALETAGSVIHSSGPFVAAVGVKNLVVVATGDAVLVMPREASQDVKKVVDHLQKAGRKSLL